MHRKFGSLAVTSEEIEIIINSSDKNKSTGPYSIPVFLLKVLCTHISCPLATLVNQSFEHGIFPNKLKLGKVNPVQKKIPQITLQIIDLSLSCLSSLRS